MPFPIFGSLRPGEELWREQRLHNGLRKGEKVVEIIGLKREMCVCSFPSPGQVFVSAK